jgi:hypothetical protein
LVAVRALLKAKRQHLERVAVIEMPAAVVAGGRALHEESVSLLLWEEYGFVVLTHLIRSWEEEEV